MYLDLEGGEVLYPINAAGDGNFEWPKNALRIVYYENDVPYVDDNPDHYVFHESIEDSSGWVIENPDSLGTSSIRKLSATD